MRSYFIAALAAVSFAVSADDMVARQGKDSVRITEGDCKLAVPGKEHMRAASAIVEGKSYAACWTVTQGHVFLTYEDGDKGVVPVQDFKPSPSI